MNAASRTLAAASRATSASRDQTLLSTLDERTTVINGCCMEDASVPLAALSPAVGLISASAAAGAGEALDASSSVRSEQEFAHMLGPSGTALLLRQAQLISGCGLRCRNPSPSLRRNRTVKDAPNVGLLSHREPNQRPSWSAHFKAGGRVPDDRSADPGRLPTTVTLKNSRANTGRQLAEIVAVMDLTTQSSA